MRSSFGKLLVLVLAIGIGYSPLSVFGTETDKTDLGADIGVLMSRYDVHGLSLAVVENCLPVRMEYFGVTSQSRSTSPDTLYRIESITKPVTALTVATLANHGTVELGAPIGKYIEKRHGYSLKPNIAELTLLQLLTHTSGLPIGDFTLRFPPDAKRPSLREIVVAEAYIDRTLNTKFSYSDAGYHLVQIVVEDATGTDFAALADEAVFRPLQMHDATFDWLTDTSARIAVGHDLSGKPVSAYVYGGDASGGLIASLGDVVRFARASMGCEESPVPNALFRQLHSARVEVSGPMRLVAEGYGLGHFTESLSDGRLSVWHGGQGYGWMSHMQLVPETGDAIVLLSNSQRAWPLFAEILRDWSDDLDVSPVGMARVAIVIRALNAIIVVAAVGSVLLFWHCLAGLAKRRMRIDPLSRVAVAPRAALLFVSLGIIGSVIWAGRQEYLFLFSIAPHLIEPLAAALTTLAAGTALTSFCVPLRQQADRAPPQPASGIERTTDHPGSDNG